MNPMSMAPAKPIFRRILIAVDDTAIAAHAADVGVELARDLGAEPGLAWVVDPSLIFMPDSGLATADLMAMAERDARRTLTDLRTQLSLNGALEFVTRGHPAAEIVKTATAWPADLIVIGSHPRRGVQRLLQSSVAEEVMRHAPCAVLVVRSRE